MITILIVWESLWRKETSCWVSPSEMYGSSSSRPERESLLICREIETNEMIWRDFIVDLYPLVVFLSVSYVLFWFVKKR